MLDIEDSIERVPLSQNNQNGLVKNKFESFFNIKTRRKQKDDVEEEKQMAKNELESVLPWSLFCFFNKWGKGVTVYPKIKFLRYKEPGVVYPRIEKGVLLCMEFFNRRG